MIASCGEALIDFVPVPSAMGTRRYDALAGGSPYNVARALGRLGIRAAFVGAISTDFFGDELVELLERSGVSLEHVMRSERPSTLSFIRMQDASAAYAFYSAASADRHWRFDPALPASFDVLHFGSNSLLLEPAASQFERLLTEAARDKLISLDPNIRAHLISMPAAYRRRLGRAFALADVVKVSEEDLNWLAPGEEPKQAAQGFLDQGVALAVVTLGPRGAMALCRHAAATVGPVDVVMADTIGAGDAFMAGLLTALSDRQLLRRDRLEDLTEPELMDALSFANGVAAVACAHRGAYAPTRDEVSPAR